MGRAKQYDREDLLERSVALFRRHGFHGTSTADLVETLGINRKSMYAEFGSKQGLFEATLDHYESRQLTAALAPVEAEDARSAGIRKAFANYAAAARGRMRGLGCLMCNTAVERGALPKGTEIYVERYLERVERAFLHALRNAQNAGELSADRELSALAAYFTSSLVGVAALVRAAADPDLVAAACDTITSMLNHHVHTARPPHRSPPGNGGINTEASSQS